MIMSCCLDDHKVLHSTEPTYLRGLLPSSIANTRRSLAITPVRTIML